MTSADPAPTMVAGRPLRAGDLLMLGREASCQFVEPIVVRLIAVMPLATYRGWRWIECYQLDRAGKAVDRRELFVEIAGIRRLPERPTSTRGGRTNQRPTVYNRRRNTPPSP